MTPQGSSLVWVDPIEEATGGRKRHVYRSTPSAFVRRCGTYRGGHTVMEEQDLSRIKATAFAVAPNACLGCLRAMGLLEYREENKASGQGADAVEYDPFGVFATEEADDV